MTDNAGNIVTVAVLGGTGKEGSGLAARWALNGYRVIIGSRDAEKAKAKAAELNGILGGEYLVGADNVTAATQGDLVVLTVPYGAHKDTLLGVKDQLSGKVLVDVTVPLVPPKVRTVQLPDGKSAAQEAQALLGETVRVVSAFQNVSSEKMVDPSVTVDCDVLVTGDDADAKADVIRLVEASGMRGVDAGPLANAIVAESLTPVLLYINKKYGAHGSGIRITGI
ncbi:MAG: NADPH-dependent F420 reductase [Pleurocapsa minor GSE-CHR-MK-17-07R]|jgi:NADPH-dependent F420 reductase|nr:NADPH-dependent F420 reductase [Pleurocapsa minor GSE-CHR-MK 17-07R]